MEKQILAPLCLQERKGLLVFQPEYQRGFVWKEPKCSKLVETILLKLPFQEVWLHRQCPANSNLKFDEVIDGQQRLTTIKAFKQGMFPNLQKFQLQVCTCVHLVLLYAVPHS